MTINEPIFQHFCSTAISPVSYGVLDFCSSQIESAKGVLIAMLGNAVYDSIPDIDKPEDLDPSDADDATAYAAYRYVCTSAMYNAIPQLDLTLSPTGFGIVNSQNVAPASSERVERLRRQMLATSEDALDDLVASLRGNPAWCDSPQAKYWFSTLIWRASMLVGFGIPQPHRSDISTLKSKISTAEIALKNIIGSDFFCELCSAMRLNASSSSLDIAISACIAFIAASVGGVDNEIILAKRSLLTTIDQLIADLPSYRNSSAYEANHFSIYENHKEDPCYFFG